MKYKQQRKRTGKKERRPSISLLERIQPDAAGIDCGEKSHFVAVPPDRDSQPVREFRTFTNELHRLADWLEQCGVKTIAMESTGVYWIPIYEILEQRGFEVVLVNDHHIGSMARRRHRAPHPAARTGYQRPLSFKTEFIFHRLLSVLTRPADARSAAPA